MNMYEKLIEHLVNDDVDRARELFHDIVVSASRSIYEDLMNEGEDEDFDVEVDTDEVGDDDGEAGFDDEEFSDEESDEDDFDAEPDMDLEDRVVDLEDQLDELMAEFESLMSDDDEDEEYGDELEVDDTESFGDEDFGGDEEESFDDTESFDELAEGIELTAAPKPVTSEESWVNTRSTNADNSGAIGAVAKPVSMTGDTAQGRAAPKVGDLPDAGKFRNVPAKDNSKLTAAPKPTTSQASGTNTVTPFPKV